MHKIKQELGVPTLLPVFDRVHLAVGWSNVERREKSDLYFFTIDSRLKYYSFCLDFGPMNLGALYHFKTILEFEMSSAGSSELAMYSDDNPISITNAVLLLGSYMIMDLGKDPSEVKRVFAAVSNLLRPYRDILPGPQTFDLSVVDCWEALHRAKTLSWIDFGPEGFDYEEYEHFDSPLNADLHVMIPNKIIAVKGPMTLPEGKLYEDLPSGGRNFSPSHLSDILTDFNVKLVVRLNEPKYKACEFEQAGIAVADLFFEDCSVPPNDIVVKFIMLLENLPGAAAVHCKAGLGRTGTLIGLYLMKNFGFTARQAIAWLRIVRPGSVIGQQQHYLVSMEAKIARLRGHPMSGPHISGSLTDPPAADTGLQAGADIDLAEVQSIVGRVYQKVEEGKRRGSLHSDGNIDQEAAAFARASSLDQAAHVTSAHGRRHLSLCVAAAGGPGAAVVEGHSPNNLNLSLVQADASPLVKDKAVPRDHAGWTEESDSSCGGADSDGLVLKGILVPALRPAAATALAGDSDEGLDGSAQAAEPRAALLRARAGCALPRAGSDSQLVLAARAEMRQSGSCVVS